jgi:hypothetical protein
MKDSEPSALAYPVYIVVDTILLLHVQVTTSRSQTNLKPACLAHKLLRHPSNLEEGANARGSLALLNSPPSSQKPWQLSQWSRAGPWLSTPV